MRKATRILWASVAMLVALAALVASPVLAAKPEAVMQSGFGVPGESRTDASRNGWCVSFDRVPVAPAPGKPRTWKVGLTYCQPLRWDADGPHQVDILTAGATYTRSYWDWSQNPGVYSYVSK